MLHMLLTLSLSEWPKLHGVLAILSAIGVKGYHELTPNVAYVINPIALRMAKTPWSFGHSECNRGKGLLLQKIGNLVMRIGTTLNNKMKIVFSLKVFSLKANNVLDRLLLRKSWVEWGRNYFELDLPYLIRPIIIAKNKKKNCT